VRRALEGLLIVLAIAAAAIPMPRNLVERV
jgi:hypothetical protein